MGLCFGMGERFGERQSCMINFPELTYGECEGCDNRVFKVHLPFKQIQELSKYFMHILFIPTPPPTPQQYKILINAY
jgi:hypothetical protein